MTKVMRKEARHTQRWDRASGVPLEILAQETWAQSLGWEGPLEKEMAHLSSILVWEIPWTE